MTTRAERQGRNESLFREVNERIAELNQTFQIEGRTATFELRASSVFNPFRLPALEHFECPDRL